MGGDVMADPRRHQLDLQVILGGSALAAVTAVGPGPVSVSVRSLRTRSRPAGRRGACEGESRLAKKRRKDSTSCLSLMLLRTKDIGTLTEWTTQTRSLCQIAALVELVMMVA